MGVDEKVNIAHREGEDDVKESVAAMHRHIMNRRVLNHTTRGVTSTPFLPQTTNTPPPKHPNIASSFKNKKNTD